LHKKDPEFMIRLMTNSGGSVFPDSVSYMNIECRWISIISLLQLVDLNALNKGKMEIAQM